MNKLGCKNRISFQKLFFNNKMSFSQVKHSFRIIHKQEFYHEQISTYRYFSVSLSSAAALADTVAMNSGTVHFKEVVNAACHAVDAEFSRQPYS